MDIITLTELDHVHVCVFVAHIVTVTFYHRLCNSIFIVQIATVAFVPNATSATCVAHKYKFHFYIFVTRSNIGCILIHKTHTLPYNIPVALSNYNCVTCVTFKL